MSPDVFPFLRLSVATVDDDWLVKVSVAENISVCRLSQAPMLFSSNSPLILITQKNQNPKDHLQIIIKINLKKLSAFNLI